MNQKNKKDFSAPDLNIDPNPEIDVWLTYSDDFGMGEFSLREISTTWELGEN